MESTDRTNMKKPNNNLISHFDVSNADLKDILHNAITDKMYTSDNQSMIDS